MNITTKKGRHTLTFSEQEFDMFARAMYLAVSSLAVYNKQLDELQRKYGSLLISRNVKNQYFSMYAYFSSEKYRDALLAAAFSTLSYQDI